MDEALFIVFRVRGQVGVCITQATQLGQNANAALRVYSRIVFVVRSVTIVLLRVDTAVGEQRFAGQLTRRNRRQRLTQRRHVRAQERIVRQLFVDGGRDGGTWTIQCTALGLTPTTREEDTAQS
jgi:hypothetical protein